MISMTSSAVAAGFLMVSSAGVNPGEQCHMSFTQDIEVSEQHIRIVQGDDSWSWHHEDGLVFNQQPQVVDEYTSALLMDYQSGLYQQAAMLDEVMSEAIDMTRYALNVAFSEMFRPNHKVVRRIDALGDNIADEFAALVSHDGTTYYVNGSQLDAFGERFSEMMDSEIEAIVTDSMGSMLMMVGRALLSGSGSIESRMEQFEARMENMATQLEADMDARAAELEQAAEGMCDNMLQLAQLEDELKRSHTSFESLSLFGYRH